MGEMRSSICERMDYLKKVVIVFIACTIFSIEITQGTFIRNFLRTPKCNLPGKCLEALIGWEYIASENGCYRLCQRKEECKWISYEIDTSTTFLDLHEQRLLHHCFLYRRCDEMDT